MKIVDGSLRADGSVMSERCVLSWMPSSARAAIGATQSTASMRRLIRIVLCIAGGSVRGAKIAQFTAEGNQSPGA
jgi:hypothetical protein